MMKTAILFAVAMLTSACAAPGPIRVRPGTDMALPEPAATGGAQVIGGAICVLTKGDRKDGDTCPQRSDSLRPTTRPPKTNGKPQMRVRNPTSVFRRG